MTKLKLCADKMHPPFEFINKYGNIDGFNVDITRSIAEEMGFEVEIELLDWSEAIKKLDNNMCDAIQGMVKTSDRQIKYSFGVEYITVIHSAFALSERKDITDFSDISKYKVAVQENDAGYEIITKMSSFSNNELILISSNQEDILRQLLTGEVDIVVGNKLTILYYIKKMGMEGKIKLIGNPINISSYCVSFNKKNNEYASIFQTGLEQIKLKGIYEKIYNKWFGQNIGYFGRQIIENVDTGVIYIDRLGRISAINNLVEKILETSNQKFIFKSFYETKIADIFNTYIIQKLLDNLLDTYYEEIKFEIKDKSHYLEVNYIRILNNKNEIMGVLINFKDITEKTKLEEFLIRKDKMESLGFLILNVAHELRNPLTSIKNFVDLMPVHIDDEEFRESLLYHVPKKVEYMNKLITDLLEYSKPKESKKTEIFLKEFIEGEFLKSVYNTVNDEKKIKFIIEIPKDFYINVDKDQLKQVLINLIQNSSDAIIECGIIKVYVDEDINSKSIVIEDNGVSIPELNISKVFDPFFTTKTNGTGLGLFICYQLMKENNGNIEIANIGNGTRVKLVFNNQEEVV